MVRPHWKFTRERLSPIGLLIFSLLATSGLATGLSQWTDTAGAQFRAEPTEVLGPFALFNLSATRGQRTHLRGLTPEDCRRFYAETSSRPPVAAHWDQAQGLISRELLGRVAQVNQHQLVPVDLSTRAEPEIFVVLFGSNNDGESWGMVHGFIPTYRRLQQIYGGWCETVFVGVRGKPSDHRRIATESAMPWLIADWAEQENMSRLARFIPREGCLMLAISRNGVPLLSSRAENVVAIKQFIDDLSDLVRSVDPTNQSSWRDRLHYLDAVRPKQYAQRQADPVLVGNPLRAEGLSQRGVTAVSARLEVGADGRVLSAVVAPTGGLSTRLQSQLAEALRATARFSPAIDHGQAVAGTYAYFFDTTPKSAATAADIAWLRGDARIEIAINSWLVLRPIPVPPNVFSSVDYIDENGTAVLTKFSVSQEKVNRAAQMNSFHTDFFATATAVRPTEGDTQLVEKTKLTWQRVPSTEGFVNLQTGVGRDYCVGYAWTELALPQALEGWLGIGSDDGLKIWLNGELIHDRWVQRISRIDDDIVPLHLLAGKNQLLIKIQNAKGDWSFISRLRVKPPAR